jgi:hypothetical protein
LHQDVRRGRKSDRQIHILEHFPSHGKIPFSPHAKTAPILPLMVTLFLNLGLNDGKKPLSISMVTKLLPCSQLRCGAQFILLVTEVTESPPIILIKEFLFLYSPS